MSRTRNHVRSLFGVLTGPGDVWLLARLLAWSLSLPCLKFIIPLPKLVLLMRAKPKFGERDKAREERIAKLAEWVFKSRPRPSRDNCLERSLTVYRYLCRAGADPTLVVGIRRPESGDLRQLHGHVWVTVDGWPVSDSGAELLTFSSVVAFGSDGKQSVLDDRASAADETEPK